VYEQVLELVDRIEDYLGGWHHPRGRRREMEVFDAVVATLFYYRHDCSQEVTGVVFGVSQPTTSRMVNTLDEPIAAVLDCEVPELVEVITSRVIIPDGTLIPTRNRAAHPELYSGKRHRSGAAVQILSDTSPRWKNRPKESFYSPRSKRTSISPVSAVPSNAASPISKKGRS